MPIQITDNTDAFLREVRSWSGKKLDACMESMVARAKEYSPWLTGNNSRSIKGKRFFGGFEVYTESGYGGWLAVGTRNRDPDDYFIRAFREAVKELRGR